jgi:site-specific recombinase XerD
MRRSELANLKAGDIHDVFLVAREGKNRKDRTIPLSGPMVLRLKAFVKGKKPTDKVLGLRCRLAATLLFKSMASFGNSA